MPELNLKRHPSVLIIVIHESEAPDVSHSLNTFIALLFPDFSTLSYPVKIISTGRSFLHATTTFNVKVLALST